jgi:hypothetical protein
MNTPTIENPLFEISLDPRNGSVRRCLLKDDPERMNWVIEPEESPWHASSLNWGLGYLNLDRRHKPFAGLARWEIPREMEVSGNACRILYEHALFTVEVERGFHPDGSFAERYRFVNRGNRDLEIENLAIHVPFNDNYPDALTCVKRRCHAHVWCGGDLVWANALRMGGEPPHLGWVVVEGSSCGYEISERRLAGNNSNVRGTISLLVGIRSIPAGEARSVAWRLFPHQGHADFMAKAGALAPLPLPTADRHTVCLGEPIAISAQAVSKTCEIRISADGKEIPAEVDPAGKATASWTPPAPGQYRVEVGGNGRKTFLHLQCVPDPMRIIERRAAFIIERQQVNELGGELDGAFLIYDNEMEKTYRAKLDYNEGRERLGMGVMIAMLHQVAPRQDYVQPLVRYHDFVRNRLQTPDATVLNGVGDSRCRGYNYPWAAWFHLEMYLAFGERRYLDDAVDTLRAFYRLGHEFYAINIPVAKALAVLGQAGLKEQRQELLAHFVRQGEFIMARGIDYPAHEVVYEQSIVGPAAQFILELYLATRENAYLAAAAPHLRCLEMFNGRQPDFHLHEIAIRHWDGWWFGKRPRWGDTFPHYWSTITANVCHRHWQATGDLNSLARAREIIMNNLCLFSPEGRGSCAYLYPELIDGEPGQYFDPYANDQDWALAHYLDMARDLACLNKATGR